MEGAMEQNMILVVSSSFTSEDGSAYAIPRTLRGRTYGYTEFHLADLEYGEIHQHFLPSLLQYVAPTSLVAVDKFVYIFGGHTRMPFNPSNALIFEPPKSHQKLFIGASRLLLYPDPSQGDEWCPVPKPDTCNFPRCTSVSSRIYTFGSIVFAPEVYDPSAEPSKWKPLLDYPPELVGSQVSYHAIPDPSKTRILVHFTNGKLESPSIYSFSPIGGWLPIVCDFVDWTPVGAVVDDVIFFNSHKFRGVLRAFDIQSKKWLKVRWTSKFDEKVNMNKRRMDLDALLPMGNRMLCLASSSPTYESDISGHRCPTTSISFLKFSVERINSTINLHPHTSHSHSYVLPATSTVLKLLSV